MPPTFEQDISAILAESDPARRRLLAAKMIDSGQYTGMTTNQARQVIDLVAQRDTIPYAQAASEIRSAYADIMQQTPVQAPPRSMDRSVQRGALVQQAQLDAAVRGGGVQLPAPYYAGPEAGREAYQKRFYQSQGANEQGMIPRQRGNLAASLLGVEGGRAWYTDPAGTAVAIAGGMGVEPGASIGYNLMREVGDPQWQTPEQASASVMRNQAAAGPVRFIRGKQAENMAGSILGTLGGYAGAAGAGGKAGARATAALGRGGARTAARVAGAVAGENLGVGLQAGVLEAGRTMDAGAGARAGWEATTPGVVASVATKLARGQQVAPLEWADLGLSVGFDGLSVFQAMRAVGLPEQVAKQAADQTVAAKELLALPPGRRAINVDPQGNVVGESAMPPTVYEPARTRATMVGDTGQARPGVAERTQVPRGRPDPKPKGPYRVEPEPEPLFAQRAETPSLTRQNIDDVLIAKAEETGVLRSADDIEAQLRDELGSEFTTRFAGPMPTELKQALEGRPHLRTLIRTNEPQAIGEDVLGRIGTDRFVSYLEQMGESRGRAAAEGLEGFTDPDIDWLVHARTVAQPNERMAMVQADALKPGATFKLGGESYTVAERGGDLVAIDADGGVRGIMGQVPITRGSLGDASPQAALDALKRADDFELSDPGFDDPFFHAPNTQSRLVRAEPEQMQGAGFEQVATMNTKEAANAWIKRHESEGGPTHMVVEKGGKYAVMRGGTLPTLMVAMGLGAVAKGISEANSPEEAEAAIQAAGMGDMDLSDPWVWAALGAVAIAGVGAAGRKAGKRIPGTGVPVEATKSTAKLGRELLQANTMPILDRLGSKAPKGKGGEATRAFVEKAKAATDEANQNVRRIKAEIIDPVAKRLNTGNPAKAPVAMRARAELEHLELLAEVDGVKAYETRGQRLIEGHEPEDGFGKIGRQYKQTYNRAYKETGRIMEESGLEIEVIGKDGKPELVPFKQQGDPKWVRNFSPDLIHALMQGGEFGREVVIAVSKVLAKANKGDEAVGEWTRIAKAIEDSYRGGQTDTGKIIRTVNAEHIRTIDRMPAVIRFMHDGEMRTVHLLETDPVRQLNTMAEKAAGRAAVAKHIGYERSTGYGREKSLADMRESIKGETQAGGVRLYDETMRSLSGLPLSQHMRMQWEAGGRAESTAKVLRSMFGALRAFGLSAAFIPNMLEPVGLGRVQFGNKRFVQALATLVTHPRALVEEMRRDGVLDIDRPQWYGRSRSLTEGDDLGNFGIISESMINSVARAFGQPTKMANGFAAVMAGAMGRQMEIDLRNGRATWMDKARLKIMGFSDAQIEQMASGTAPDALYKSLLSRSARYVTGSGSKPHELSMAANTPEYRAVLWFDHWRQHIFNRTGRILAAMLGPGSTKPERAAAAIMAADLGIGAATAGLGGIWLKALLFGGVDGLETEWNRSKQELSGEEGAAAVGRFFARTFEAYFGGPMYSAGISVMDDGATSEDLLRASGGLGASFDLFNFFTGQGRYAHLPLHEQTDLLLRSRTPLYRGMSDWLAAHALGDDNPAYDAAKREVYRYLRDHDLISSVQASEAGEFTVGMRRARRFIMAGEYEKAREAMIDAAQSDGRNWDQVRQSLLGMRILPRIPLQDRAKHLQAIRARLGEDGYARVLMHDRLLEAMAR
ncbi:MAG: hypothetical protein ACIAQU_04410 [Phycisphaerales bacterium JB064]